MIENGTLPPASLVDALLTQRAELQSLCTQGQSLLEQLDAEMGALGEACSRLGGALTNVDTRLDRLLWKRLLEVCQAHLFVAPIISGGWDCLVETDTPFVREQVDAALAALGARRRRMLVCGIALAAVHLFDSKRLEPHARTKGLFTYSPPWSRGGYGCAGWFLGNEQKTEHLDALYRLMCLAEGRAWPAADDLPSNWVARPDYSAAPWQVYFTVDRYKNGNGRITIQRMDLARQLNACLDEWDQARVAVATAPAALIGGGRCSPE